MQINMQIVLSQGDIENAVRAYLRQEVPIQEGQDINVAFDFAGPEEVTVVAVVGKEGVVSMTKTSPTTTTAVRERGKPSPGRARRTQAEIAEDEAAERAEAGEAKAETEAAVSAIATNAVFPGTISFDTSAVDPAIMAQLGETVDNDPPFEVDSKTVQTSAQTDAVITTPKTTSSIFPSSDSSAPAITHDDPPPPPVVTSAKSLFANLGSPSVN